MRTASFQACMIVTYFILLPMTTTQHFQWRDGDIDITVSTMRTVSSCDLKLTDPMFLRTLRVPYSVHKKDIKGFMLDWFIIHVYRPSKGWTSWTKPAFKCAPAPRASIAMATKPGQWMVVSSGPAKRGGSLRIFRNAGMIARKWQLWKVCRKPFILT